MLTSNLRMRYSKYPERYRMRMLGKWWKNAKTLSSANSSPISSAANLLGEMRMSMAIKRPYSSSCAKIRDGIQETSNHNIRR